jgi:hypothetical protein
VPFGTRLGFLILRRALAINVCSWHEAADPRCPHIGRYRE